MLMLNKKFIYKHGPQLKWLQDQHVVVVFVLFCVGFFFRGGGAKIQQLMRPVFGNIAIPGQIPWLTSYRLKLL